MLSPDTKTPHNSSDEALQARVREAAQMLEEIGRDRGLLARISSEDRKRLLNAVGVVFSPDIGARRRLRKEALKQQKASVVRHEDRVYAETGIRKLRRETVFTTPNVFPPTSPDALDAEDARDEAPHIAELEESIHCYVCKQHFTAIHHFYDQLCPTCAEFNFAKRTETRRSSRTRGAPHRRPRQDRLSGGDSSCCAPARS